MKNLYSANLLITSEHRVKTISKMHGLKTFASDTCISRKLLEKCSPKQGSKFQKHYLYDNDEGTSQSDSRAADLGNSQSVSEEAFGRDFFKKMNLMKILNVLESYLKKVFSVGAKLGI